MLSALIWMPIFGAVLIGLLPASVSSSRLRSLAIASISVAFAWSLYIANQFDVIDIGLQFQEDIPWLDSLGLTYRLGIDGLSLPLVILNNLLTIVALWCSDASIQRPRLYYLLILVINSAVAGAFLAHNLLLFFLFYELELIPLYLLIGIWGGAKRGYAATKFLIYTAISGILILMSFLGLIWLSGSNTFEYNPLLSQGLPLTAQIILLGGILIGFGIKIPLFPLHTWLPDAHVEASTPISVLLAGVLLKLGTYGLIRFGLELFPQAWSVLAPWLAGWAVVSVLFGAFTAIAQTDMKKMVAYSSIAHMGFILLAVAAATPISLLGTVFQMVSHALISGLLFVLVGVVYKTTGTRDINILQGLLTPERGLPIIGSLMVMGVMASAGIPGMMGFISEFLIFRGSFEVFPVQTLLSMIGTGLTAVYFLLLVNKVFFGRLPDALANLPRVTWSERLPGFALAVMIVVLGLQPNWMVRWVETTTTAAVNDFTTIAARLPNSKTADLPPAVSETPLSVRLN
ncbi:NADH-quinone oxidoreductase subunit M [Myxacorys almedinensis]|uniref:NADH-quinone oxidoreductase subunit M n=1 Tax=Myxacorys almedinensis A TaxID=2690445 RepID=A0A8J7Z2H9_9CYAN|nr:NADH-quinone oxidoreductase subunit M [Myxacorys almedinensis]NDJ18085.1 NADH-quinone oxidoreductase subunit M [Myxacorys almedinensis A]